MLLIRNLHAVAETVTQWILQFTPHRMEPPAHVEISYAGDSWSFSIGDTLILDSESGLGDYPHDEAIYAEALTPELAMKVWRWHLRRIMLVAGIRDGGDIGGQP